MKKPFITDPMSITGMIRAPNMMLNGLKIKSSLMLPIASVIQFCEKNQSSESWVLSVPLLTQVINSNHSCKLHPWIRIPHLTSSKARLSMKIEKSQSGFDSGRFLQRPLLDHGLLFIHSKSMLVTVLLLLDGWHKIGTSGKFLNNSRMVLDGVLKTHVIVTIMII